ncbi:MAG: nitroreductase family protein [Ignavibacteria bacterium]|nr:nitroreductase family protein [Ignavibacteria bacterium]
MENRQKWIESIKQRISVRTYEEREIEKDDLDKLNRFIDEVNKGMNTKVKFSIIQNDSSSDQSQKLGTYGIIKGTNTFITAIIQNDEKDVVEIGYFLEKIILYATGLGLGTCWLGGTFNRKDFENYIALGQDESLALLIALGYRKDKQSMIETAMRFMAKSDQRKPASELFFEKDSEHSLDLNQLGDYAKVLELVRIAPSASNKQPWRIVRNNNNYEFYCCRTPSYGIMNYDLQMNDIGIAKCHFELSALELGLKGRWVKQDNMTSISNFEYVVSWECE